MARTAQPIPIITKKKDRSTDMREIPARLPKRKALPRNISKSPKIKTKRAVSRLPKKETIYIINISAKTSFNTLLAPPATEINFHQPVFPYNKF